MLVTSDQDGWNHLYGIPMAGGTPRQITRGKFEVSFPAWSHDGTRIFFVSTREGPEQRHVYAVPSDRASGQRPGLDPFGPVANHT